MAAAAGTRKLSCNLKLFFAYGPYALGLDSLHAFLPPQLLASLVSPLATLGSLYRSYHDAISHHARPITWSSICLDLFPAFSRPQSRTNSRLHLHVSVRPALPDSQDNAPTFDLSSCESRTSIRYHRWKVENNMSRSTVAVGRGARSTAVMISIGGSFFKLQSKSILGFLNTLRSRPLRTAPLAFPYRTKTNGSDQLHIRRHSVHTPT